MIIHWRKAQHYFIVRLSQDLFGDWVVTRSWGNLDNNLRGGRQNLADDRHQALALVEQIRRRQQARGYREVD